MARTLRVSVLVLVLAAAAIAFAAVVNLRQNERLFAVKTDGKWGLIDSHGRIAVKPEFESINFWSEGLTGVSIGKKWGFIDRNGKIVIPAQFDVVGLFSEGLAAVSVNGKWGYIDRKGKIVIQPQYYLVYEFHEGLAVVWVNEEEYGYIDKHGKVVIEPKLKKGFMFEYKFSGYPSYNFSEGFACVQFGAEEKYQYGFIDKKGNIKEWRFGVVLPFSEGLAPVAKEINGAPKVGFIDTAGQLVIGHKFDMALPFSEGLAAAWQDGKFFYIDKKGRKTIEINADGGGIFSEGLARVYTGDNCGYIDRKGKMVIGQKFYRSFDVYDMHDNFESGVASVSQLEGDEWTHGYIDKTGKYIYSYKEKVKK